MTREEAIKILKRNRLSYDEQEAEQFCKAYSMAVDALDLITHLNNRPCEACEYHKENGCCKWDCVFDELIYWEHR